MTQLPRTSSHLLAFVADADPQKIAETLVAFANTDGGTIVVGYDERGKPAPSVMPEDIESALREAANHTTPPVRASLEPGGASGPQLIIRVPRSVDLHSLTDGRVMVRVAGENRALTGDEIRNLVATKAIGDYEIESVPGATMADLDAEIITEYIGGLP